MAQPRGLSLRLAAVLAAAATTGAAGLAGCATHSERERAAAPAAVSYDFGALLVAPFGTLLKDISIPLAEVLVFQEASDSHARGHDDCFRPKLAVVFLGRPPTDYLLCFDHDRLKCIEASVALPAVEAPAVFAAACAEWRGQAQAPGADACGGRRGESAFSARRIEGPEPSEATISIILSGVSEP